MTAVGIGYERLVARFLDWARENDDIRAVVQVGSRARADHVADEWSDVDLLIFARDGERYMRELSWIERIGPLWLSVASRTAGGDPERLALFEGGYAVDFVWVPAEMLARAAEAGVTPDVIKRGCRLLLDKDGIAAPLIPAHPGRPMGRKPAADEFRATCDGFWYTAVYMAKQLRRGDLWLAQAIDGHLKTCALAMLEWHAAANGRGDTWHRGRFMREWADPRALAEIPGTFGAFELASAWDALLASMRLFGWVSAETAEAYGIQHELALYAEIERYIRGLRASEGDDTEHDHQPSRHTR